MADAFMGSSARWVVLCWRHEFGYHFVGPFASVDEANNWAVEVLETKGFNLDWQVVFADPTLSIPVRDPGTMPLLQPDPETDPELGRWLQWVSREMLGQDRSLPAWLGDPLDHSTHDRWTERQGPTGNFYVIMTTSEPLHMVGPFSDHRGAFSWGCASEERGGDPGWQAGWTTPAVRRCCDHRLNNQRNRAAE
jgi:hypothetical protein